MARYKSDIRASVRDILRDEFVEGVDLEWESDELDRLIRLTLDEIEQKMPYEEKVTTLDDGSSTAIVTTADSKEIDISQINDLIRIRRDKGVEYRVGKNPKQFRNWIRFADVLTMEINFLPSADEAVYLYCLKKHTLTDNTSTLRDEHETVLIQGVTARAAMNKGREQINALNVGGVNVGPRMVGWGKDQLSLYRQALKHHAIKDYWENLPKD